MTSASDRYDANQKRIADAIKDVTSLMAMHREAFEAGGSTHYGFVGDAAEVADLLETAVAFLMGEEE